MSAASSSPYSITLPINNPEHPELLTKLDGAIISVNNLAATRQELAQTSSVSKQFKLREKIPTLLSVAVKNIKSFHTSILQNRTDAPKLDTTTLVTTVKEYKRHAKFGQIVTRKEIEHLLEKLNQCRNTLMSPHYDASHSASETARLRSALRTTESALAVAEQRIKYLEAEIAHLRGSCKNQASVATTSRR